MRSIPKQFPIFPNFVSSSFWRIFIAMAPQLEYSYSKLAGEGHEPISPRMSKTNNVFSLTTVILLVFAAMLGSGSTFLASRLLQIPPPTPEVSLVPVNAATPYSTLPTLSCGNSTNEAIAAGCTFDRLTFAWLHPQCPRDFEQEHLDHNKGQPWEYWVDKEATQLLPQDDDYETISYMDTNYSRNSEHLTHCVFIVLRFYKVMIRGGERIDIMTKHYAHAHHCLMFLLRLAEKNPEFHEIATLGTVGFLEC
jgi:hypothetical protein